MFTKGGISAIATGHSGCCAGGGFDLEEIGEPLLEIIGEMEETLRRSRPN